MSVYDDYRNKQWDAYFTALFRLKHLRPYLPVPVGGHAEARQRARIGNVGLNRRAQRGQPADRNTLLFDFDPDHKVEQILQLMEEVEQRNAGHYYQDNPGLMQTLHSYYIQTSGHGSRQEFLWGPFEYKVALVNGRYVINHFEGVVS